MYIYIICTSIDLGPQDNKEGGERRDMGTDARQTDTDTHTHTHTHTQGSHEKSHINSNGATQLDYRLCRATRLYTYSR